MNDLENSNRTFRALLEVNAWNHPTDQNQIDSFYYRKEAIKSTPV